MTETTQGNESNGTEQPRRARSSTERSRAHRAKKKLEREAALKAEAERVAEAVAGVPGDAENAVADAGPGPAEQQAEREAAALHEAERAEREADATETATIERVAGRVADVADTVASVENVVSVPPPVADIVASPENGVPATKVEWFAWRILPPVEGHAKPDYTTLLIALAIATVSAGFSIYGLTSVFTGALYPVIAMGIVLEGGKLRAISLIGVGRGSWRLRAALIFMVAILMGLNAVGAYGFLARAHIAATEKAKAATEEAKKAIAASQADIDGKIAVQNSNIANINRQLSEIHAVIDKATAQGKTNGAMALINQQRNNLAQLQTDLQAVGRVLADLKVEKAKIEPSSAKDEKGKEDESKAKEVEAELGPVRHLAALLGADSETAFCWFTLVVAMLLDPLAVLLLLAATHG